MKARSLLKSFNSLSQLDYIWVGLFGKIKKKELSLRDGGLDSKWFNA